MAKNRKNQTADIRFGPVLKVVLLCSLICGSAIGYVWQKSQIDKLGREITEYETQLKQLKNNNKLVADQIAFMQAPVMLDRLVNHLNLGLAPAQPSQVVRLLDSLPMPGQESQRQFALRPVPGATP